MHVVRALVSGPWRSVDLIDGMGVKIGDKALIRALEHGRWSIDNRAVDVEPGLCVSFRDDIDASFFLNNRRAEYIVVEPDALVPFESEADALFFVNRGLGELLSKREVDDILDHVRKQQEAANAETADGEQGADDGGTDDDNDGDVDETSTSSSKPAGKQAAAKGSRNKGRRR